MLSSPSANIFGSLNYLFQEQSSKEGQPLPNAPFSLTGAVSGGNAFASPLAPDQQPKKRKIYLDYASFYRLWRPEQLALIIAKLQQEEFEVAFIQNDVNGNIFASSIEDKAEGDNKYDYKFKDKNGKEIGIFELSDDYIKENFSKLDHEKSIERLGLVRDESIILSFEQFDQIHKVFTQERWDDKLAIGSIIDYIVSENNKDIILISEKFSLLLQHKDFDINDSRTLGALNHLAAKLVYNTNIENLFNKIEDVKILEDLFDKIPSLTFFEKELEQNEKAKINIQKTILEYLWYSSSNFEAVVNRAKTLDEFKSMSHEEIAESIDPECITFSISINKGSYPADIFERIPKHKLAETTIDDLHFSYILTIVKQKKDDISFDFNFINHEGKNLIEITTNQEKNIANKKINLEKFIELFSNSEINQHFNLTERFGNDIINYLEQKNLLGICNSFSLNNHSNFLEQLNDNQKTQFIDLLKTKTSEEKASGSIDKIYKVKILSILQHHLDQPEILELTKSILKKFSNNQYSYDFSFYDINLTPTFQDLLLEMHDSNEIDLQRIKFKKNSHLYLKFNEADKSDENINRSSKELTSSPLQITLLNLNEEYLKRIKTEITSGELDASKILSINVRGIGEVDSGAKKTEKEDLLTEFVELFPNLKHAKIDTKDIPEFKSERFKSPRFILKIYNSSQSSKPPVNVQPIQSSQQSQFQFKATKKGDTIFIGNAGGSGADKKDTTNTFLMEETGKIIKRPANHKKSLYLREASQHLNPKFASIGDELFVDIDPSKATPTPEIQKFSIKEFESRKTQLERDSSQDKTICSFSKTLKSGKKTTLPSISPDNKIIGYYTDPPSTDVKFFKDESGFYYAQTNKRCKIHYIIEGKELQLKEINDQNLKDLDPRVTTIIKDYVGEAKGSFPLSVKNDQYKLPQFSAKKQFFDDLFNIDNKGSCRHRVASLAHKFEENSLKCGEDYRIIGVNGNHVVLEVKKQGNTWATLDLGGEQTKLVERKPSLLSRFFKSTTASPTSSCLSCFGYGIKKSEKPIQTKTPSQNPSSPTLLSIKEASILEQSLAELRQLPKIKDITNFKSEFSQFIAKKDSSSLYLKTSNSEELKNYLLRMSSDSQDSNSTSLTTSALSFQAFYVSSPQDLTIKKSTIHVKNGTKDLAITDDTPLFSFLQNAEQNKNKQHVLIIDWGKFDAGTQVAFNAMFDKGSRKIDGEKIPDNVKIICIDDSKQKTLDNSILSRFGRSLDVSPIRKEDLKLKSPSAALPNIEKIEFDGEGFADWREKLFGRFVVNGAKMEWQKSDFVKSLEAFGTTNSDSNLQLDFKNFSTSQQQEMKIFFAQAQASGLINYHDYEIKIPRSLTLNFTKKEFEFENILQSFASKTQDLETSSPSLPTLKIYKDVQASKILPQDTYLINSFLFNQLLIQPKIEDGQYREELGLIEQASQSSSKTLKLYLSEDLSNEQFYCLLNQAKEHQVSLELTLAQGVKIPDQEFNKFVENKSIAQEDSGAGVSGARISGDLVFASIRVSKSQPLETSSKPPRITITNNIEESLNSLKESLSSPTIINIEDASYSDLFGKNQHKLVSEHNAQHFAFEKIESDLKAKLDGGESVILKGEFSAELLPLLHPQILDLQQQYSNLYFIIEDKNVSKSKPQSSKLSWLDPSLYEIKHSPETAKIDKKIAREDHPCVEDKISDNSKAESEKFIQKRKTDLSEFLQENPILQIFGHSGVGKSSLLREVEKSGLTQAGDVAVYNELTGFDSWAKDKSESKTKILVIDEFNVDGSTNFTMFRDLANNPTTFPQTIFHDGKSYELDASHKVVFLGNPPNYGNRFKQKLFEDCQIPEWHLQDFPVDYIYENILKTPIYDGCSEDIKTKINEEEFKKIAIEQIKDYKAKNQGLPADDGMPKETVRELQEKVLKEIVKQISPTETKEVQNANFIATPSNQQSIDELQSAIQIRQLQKQGELPSNFLGTCGVIFEGDSGVGKSVMIEAVLENRGITKIDSLEDLEKEAKETNAKKPHHYYKISASMPIEEIKKQLIKAFELGVIVVFDEMNTRIKDGGLEKTINALLTGQHPEDPKIKPQAGFMLIASVNKATNAGRTAFSPAILHRSTVIKAESLREYTQEDFEKIIGNWVKSDASLNKEFGAQIDFIQHVINENSIKETAKQFKKIVSAEDNQDNLRDLKSKLPQILQKLNNNNPVQQLLRILKLNR